MVNKFISVLLLFFSVVALCGCSSDKRSFTRESRSIFEFEDLINLYIPSIIPEENDVNDAGDGFFDMQENGRDYINYFTTSARAITWIMEYKKDTEYNQIYLEQAQSVVENLIGTFERNGCFPRPQYNDLKYGWVSSMDAPTIMILSQMLYEITDEERYQQFTDDLKDYVVKDVSGGGYNVNLDGKIRGIWPLEYADDEKEADEFYYVNNGSIVGYLGTKIISLTEYDKSLEDYLSEVESAYESMQEYFVYDKYQWTFYMLNEKTVIPPHYMIFEEKLYYACSQLSDKEFWKDGYKYRKDALKSVLSIDFYEENDSLKGIMRRACAPHPYLLDIYETEVRFLDENDNIIGEWRSDISGSCADDIDRFEDGEFLGGIVPENSVKYQIYTISDGASFLMFESEIEEISDVSGNWNNISDMPDAAGDIKMIDEEYEFDSELSEESNGQLIYELDKNMNLNIDSYYGIPVNNDSQNIYSVNVILYDSEGNGCSRYLPELKPGNNLLLLNEIGFSDINELTDINKVVVRFYGEDEARGKLMPNQVVKFDTIYSLYQYRQSNPDYLISPQ